MRARKKLKLDMNILSNFFNDKEKCPKLMICGEIIKIKANHHKETLANMRLYDKKNIKYAVYRIASVEHIDIIYQIQELVDYHIIIRNELFNNKYRFCDMDIIILYTNPNFIKLIKLLNMIEFVAALENEEKYSMLLEEVSKYYEYYKQVC